ncbi:MAG: PilZ domain-containing protein [Candidatus Omnitrophica bacterium]|nr:PilZ domain-containing protein [Candidatus Omnitrophota bacterium]
MEKVNNNYKDRRIFQRFSVKLPVRFIDLYRNEEGEGFSQDISAKGVGLVTEKKLSTYTPLELWLNIPDGKEPLYVRGEVVWVNALDSFNYRVGINLERADLMGISRILRLK